MAKKNQIYQLVSYVNAYNKRKKAWEPLRNERKIYRGTNGLQTASAEYRYEVNKYKFIETSIDLNKYREMRGKVELHIPHFHDNGAISYWGDQIILSHNPLNI